MKIELKKIKHSPSLSEETEAFTAELYIEEKRAGIASSRGQGGNTDYTAYDDAGRELIKMAEAYCKTLPDKKFRGEDMEDLTYPMDLEQFIDDLLYGYLEEKDLRLFNRKLERATEKGIMYGVPDDSFSGITFKTTLQDILAHPAQRQSLIGTINKKVLPHLRDGNILLNTNIPEDILHDAGLRPDQYRKPVPEQKPAERMAKGRAKRP